MLDGDNKLGSRERRLAVAKLLVAKFFFFASFRLYYTRSMRKETLLVALALSLSVVTLPVAAMPTEDTIKASCSVAQAQLNQVEKSDAALRINRGRIYNETLELLYAMNARLASNQIAAATLASITSDFDQELTDFRSDYNEYDDDMSDLIDFKCQSKPTEFYEKLESVRDERLGLSNRVTRLDTLMREYQDNFAEIKLGEK